MLFEDVILVSTQLNQREDAARSLGLCVRTSRGISNGAAARSVLIRLTDPHDPLLLFQLELSERDYGALKQQLELLVDFNGFPGYVVSMLESIVHGDSPLQATFAVQPQNSGVGVLRVIEANPFKTVEHLSLALVRGGDAEQKRFLAEQFLHFQQAYLRCAAERSEEAARAEGTIEDLRATARKLQGENRQLREELKLTSSESERSALAQLRDAQDAHRAEVGNLREGYEARLRSVQEKADSAESRLREDLRGKDGALERLQATVVQMESAEAALQSKLRLAEDKNRLQDDELCQLRLTVDELAQYKQEATAAMKENEVSYAAVTERLRWALSTLEAREEELSCLRESAKKHDKYIHSLSAQNERLTHQSEAAEANLAKAHHIIANQLQTIRASKERYTIATEQIRSQQALLNERDLSQQRLKDELAAALERVQTLQQKNGEMREQLQTTDDAREKLGQELKHSQAALLHLQRSTSVNGRHWGVFASASPSYRVASVGSSGVGGASYDFSKPTPFPVPSRVYQQYTGGEEEAEGDGGHRRNGVTEEPKEVHRAAAGDTTSPSPAREPCAKGLAKTTAASLPRSSVGLTTTASSASFKRHSTSPTRVSPNGEAPHFAAKSFFPSATPVTTGTSAAELRGASAYF